MEKRHGIKLQEKNIFTSFLPEFEKKEVCFFLQLSSNFWLSSLTKESIIYFRELGYLQAFAILKCIFKIHSDSKTNNSSTAMIFILFCFVCSNIFELDQHWLAKLHQLLKKMTVKFSVNLIAFFVVLMKAA